jgi:glycerol-3-phosphate acyltransferase PlsX
MGRNILTRIGYLFARGAFDSLRIKLDPARSNGGTFLGLNGIVVKSHGGTDAHGFAFAVGHAYGVVRNELLAKIAQDLAQYHRAGIVDGLKIAAEAGAS